ncbi:family 16 glycosylhydrolase [Rhizobium grahamii]|uniref:Family 16 glycosylhydrolase n=1 Tax=Rhizobium grahamii TaxID=1120045 RepID=A0A5Q0C527_9HYPH|nr:MULTISPECIES: glycoside hydrolase family 16 protein [Rhizobium]QFY61038.1 family 16 glycosylhydrolase [Rhizobium grahamii]QRM49811.1 family 16 glycosylhydrolase [Rhizobium sp. BG6]
MIKLTRARTLSSALVIAGTAFAAASAANAQQASGTSFVENFDKLDKAFWYTSDGWNNGAHQNCTWSKSQAKVDGGSLNLSFAEGKSKDRSYLCGEIQTTKRYSYGVYEARLKAATGSGLNSAFFTYIGPADKKEHDEIDFEVLGKNTSEVQVNQYVKAKGGHEKLVPVGSKADDGFNDYAFVWEPGRLRYYLNGKLVQDVTDASKIPTSPQKIFLSLWGTDTLSDWMGRFSYTAPATMQIDRIAYTATGDKCQFPDSIACALN